MEKEVLRLFKGYLGEKSNVINEEGLKYGLLIPNTATQSTVDEAIKLYGKDGAKWNKTLHKDFEIVRNAPIEDLIAQQVIHYITTYGFESLGMYDADLVYIPKEKLEIPELDVDNIELITIKPMSIEELCEKLMTLLTSGIALSEQSVKDIMVLSDYIDKERFDEIKNKEVKTALYDKYNIMPKNPDEFLRYLLFKTTGETLKIQNVKMVYAIKNCNKKLALEMLCSYIDKNGYAKLSTIFLRNKNLFLAFKTDKTECNNDKDKKVANQLNAIINKLRKYAIKYHKPLKTNILDCLTDENVQIDLAELKNMLNDITIFREIRILNGVLYRLYGNDNIVYKIRNGKSYVKQLQPKTADNMARLQDIATTIRAHLVERLSAKVKDKIIYIPNNITYAAPTSEKQFNGNIPEGSYLEMPRNDNMVYGVHWNNIPIDKCSSRYYGEEVTEREERVDLDLKQMNKSEVFGWDASYRSATSDILFSGDITGAPTKNGGATELFYVGQNYGHGAFLITLNMFTSNSNDVPFEFVIAKATHKPQHRVNYALDPNNILEKIDMVIKKTERQMVVGFITIGDTIRFYFNDFSAGGDIKTPRGCSTSTRNEITMGAFDYLQSYSKTQLKLNDLFKEAGAFVVDTPTIKRQIEVLNKEGEKEITFITTDVDINLSPSVISKESLIELLSGE